MKNLLITIILTLMFLSINANESDSIPIAKQLEILQTKIDKIDKAMLDIDLKVNKLIYEKFLSEAEDTEMTISIFALKTFNADKICDTVPQIKPLREEWTIAKEELVEILNNDREYRNIRSGKKKNTSDSRKLINNVYTRLHATDSSYVAARERYNKTLSAQNVAIARFLLDHYQNIGEILPTEGIISNDQLGRINNNRTIDNLTLDRRYLESLNMRYKREYINLKYAIDEPEKN